MEDELKFTTAAADMKERLREIWQSSFEEDSGYADMFFSKRFVPDETFVAILNGLVVSMMFALPVTISNNGNEYNAMYIYGVATDKAFRNRKISTMLMEYAHIKIKAAGYKLSLLVPANEALFDFYSKQGFVNAFFLREFNYSSSKKNVRLEKVTLASQKKKRDSFFGACGTFAMWDKAALSYLDTEISYLDGETLLFKTKDEEGYAVCYPTPEGVIIKEWAASKIYPEVLDAIAARFNKTSVTVRLSSLTDAGKIAVRPFAMTYSYMPERKNQIGRNAYLSLVLD